MWKDTTNISNEIKSVNKTKQKLLTTADDDAKSEDTSKTKS